MRLFALDRFLLVLLLAIVFDSFPVCSSGSPLQETLPNGLQVFILENRGTTSVSVDLWIKAGSRHESPKNNGISHFVEHLLFKGTSRRTAKDISREISAIGGSMNAFTYWEYTQLHLSLLPMHLDLALDILADVAQNSLMTEEMIEKERKVVLEEISLAAIYPPSYVLNLVQQTLFPENPLGMPLCGTKETVKAFQRNELMEYYRLHYVPNNAFLTIVGNVEGPTARALIREKFNLWPEQELPPSSLFPPLRQGNSKEVTQRKFLDQAIVVVAIQAMGLKDLDRPTFEIINAILGSGSNSRLYQEVRENRGLAYLIGALYHPLSNTGLWATYAGTAPKNVKELKSIIFREIRRIREEPLSRGELDEIKRYIRGRTLIRNENNGALADFIAQGLLSGAWEMPADFLARVEAVNAEDVQRVAQTYLREDQFNVIILKPYPGLRLFRGLL